MARKYRILVVDDDPRTRAAVVEIVRALGHETEVAADGVGALAMVKLDIDLVLTDLNMPGMDGFEVIRRIRQDAETADVPIIMITGLADEENRLRAVEVGANDFIGKPFNVTELRARTTSLLKLKEQQEAIRQHQVELEETVRRRTEALRQALDQMAQAQRQTHQAHLDTIQRLAIAAEYKDEDTASHIRRMSGYCATLAGALNLPPGEVEMIRDASPMHDVGKMGVPDGILLKKGKLDTEEWAVMKKHTVMGSRILRGSNSALLVAGEVFALSHHEKWDGSGYPEGIKGEDIPLQGRICAVADVFDALTTKRPYKEAMPNDQAFGILHEGCGSHFDPRLIDLFFDNIDEILSVQQAHQDESIEPPTAEDPVSRALGSGL
ncbi:MAG: two-component system response regulator [Armatimonadetes bacterium CG_4_10_14_3_um_filter_66_18]|nr:response regulator [Armatimonadota bacterium]OIP10733.1 MAG: two-component system response regulator [Armatimonadetes bacterium CG2_30_66_41]PIU94802.1 MAG: two-component system response regulator [Armatimonadetes bacterium CG06_land_8_20_14_3_00_66_21]PIW13059.1 MAG: two-component system response regulator [Armatimonadetes bacterium CG17_big_fil_post_rev_8_21_14_2_50_66_6]PIX36748.1 MAG: two-component system response regulator [Armatimonadetes bacterium CG_4_8_14_3_um_filter_66_20]PIY39162